MAWGRAYPSYTGTPWETPSPESMTIPVVRPEAYRESTAWMATYMAGMLKVSNMIWVIFSLLALGLRGEDDPDHVRDLPADVDLQAGVRRVRPIHCPPQVLLNCQLC